MRCFVRKLFALSFALLLAAPLVAQQHQMDHDKKIEGGGTLPAGWKGRLDGGGTSTAGVKMTPMGGGVHFMTGPAGIYYRPADKTAGAYSAAATFTQMEPAAHPEAYGIFIGGGGLSSARRRLTYTPVRPEGPVVITRRARRATPAVAHSTGEAAREEATAAAPTPHPPAPH